MNPYNQRMLTRPGIGQLSPTMARHRDRRRVGKQELALAVRKDFNAASVSEVEVITNFLYTVHNQGTFGSLFWGLTQGRLIFALDKNFRMRFEPTQSK